MAENLVAGAIKVKRAGTAQPCNYRFSGFAGTIHGKTWRSVLMMMMMMMVVMIVWAIIGVMVMRAMIIMARP